MDGGLAPEEVAVGDERVPEARKVARDQHAGGGEAVAQVGGVRVRGPEVASLGEVEDRRQGEG